MSVRLTTHPDVVNVKSRRCLCWIVVGLFVILLACLLVGRLFRPSVVLSVCLSVWLWHLSVYVWMSISPSFSLFLSLGSDQVGYGSSWWPFFLLVSVWLFLGLSASLSIGSDQVGYSSCRSFGLLACLSVFGFVCLSYTSNNLHFGR